MNDLISRQAAIAEFKHYALYDSNRTNAEWVRRIELVLEALPSAEKHGKWVLITKDYIDPQEYKCSVCGRTIKYYGIPALLLERYPYCNCGARMDDE